MYRMALYPGYEPWAGIRERLRRTNHWPLTTNY